MPNWVTTNIKSSPRVIQAMLNEEGKIDFSRIVPLPCRLLVGQDISVSAETLAKKETNAALNANSLIASLEASNRRHINREQLNPPELAQLEAMLINIQECGYPHPMAAAIDLWGTKWNACEQSADPEAGTATFATAWSLPKPVLIALSTQYPDELISIEFADEDIGYNCGSLELLGGEITKQHIAEKNRNPDEHARWKAFAYRVKGWNPEEDEEEDE